MLIYLSFQNNFESITYLEYKNYKGCVLNVKCDSDFENITYICMDDCYFFLE